MADTASTGRLAPLFSVVIPNWNGARFLPTCLAALARQTYPCIEVIVADNASTDGSQALLRERYPAVTLLALPQNLGFTGACNAGIAAARGNYIALLNNDTEADPRWLERLVGALDRFPAYDFAASKLLLFDRRDHIHSAGDYYGMNGVPGNRGVWQRDRGQYDVMEEVFGPCAGAAAYRRAALEALAEGGKVFDEDLVMYCEDVDLNLRARLRGVRTVYVPRAVVYHKLSATGGGALASYYCGRNFVLVWAKNMPEQLVRRHWPALVRAQLGFALTALLHVREPAARARLRGQLDSLRALPRFLRKRRPSSAHVAEAALS